MVLQHQYGAQIFGEVLPYLEIKKDGEQGENINIVVVPNIIGMNIKDAENKLKEVNLELSINNSKEDIDKDNTLITNQIPDQGIQINEGSKIYVDF